MDITQNFKEFLLNNEDITSDEMELVLETIYKYNNQQEPLNNIDNMKIIKPETNKAKISKLFTIQINDNITIEIIKDNGYDGDISWDYHETKDVKAGAKLTDEQFHELNRFILEECDLFDFEDFKIL